MRPGLPVVIIGLKGRVELNGLAGHVADRKAASGRVAVRLPQMGAISVLLSNLVLGPVVPALSDDLWLCIWRACPAWRRPGLSAVSKGWRYQVLHDPELWRHGLVIARLPLDCQLAYKDSATYSTFDDSWDGELDSQSAGESDGLHLLPYLIQGYVPLTPGMLKLLPNTAWVENLAVAEVGRDPLTEAEHEHHFLENFSTMQAMSRLSFPRLRALLLSVGMLDLMPLSANTVHWEEWKHGAPPWRATARLLAQQALFPWLLRVGSTIEYCDFGSSHGGSSFHHDFGGWLHREHQKGYLDWLPNLKGLRHPSSYLDRTHHRVTYERIHSLSHLRLQILRDLSPQRREQIRIWALNDYYTAAELCELLTLLPALERLQWIFTGGRDFSPQQFQRACAAFPPTLWCLCIEAEDVSLPTSSWLALANTNLRQIYVSIDEWGGEGLVGRAAGVAGPRAITALLAEHMPRAAVLFTSRSEDADDASTPDGHHATEPYEDLFSQSPMTSVFLPKLRQRWEVDMRRRVGTDYKELSLDMRTPLWCSD